MTISTETAQGRSMVDFLAYAQLAAPAAMLSFANRFYTESATRCLVEILPNLPVSEIQRLVAGGGSDFAADSNGPSMVLLKFCVGSSIQKVFILVAGAGGLTVAATVLMSGMGMWPASVRRIHSNVS